MGSDTVSEQRYFGYDQHEEILGDNPGTRGDVATNEDLKDQWPTIAIRLCLTSIFSNLAQ